MCCDSPMEVVAGTGSLETAQKIHMTLRNMDGRESHEDFTKNLDSEQQITVSKHLRGTTSYCRLSALALVKGNSTLMMVEVQVLYSC